MQWIWNYGPVIVWIRGGGGLQSYRGGVYSGSCGTDSDGHFVLVTGYDNRAGKNYWIIKNVSRACMPACPSCRPAQLHAQPPWLRLHILLDVRPKSTGSLTVLSAELGQQLGFQRICPLPHVVWRGTVCDAAGEQGCCQPVGVPDQPHVKERVAGTHELQTKASRQRPQRSLPTSHNNLLSPALPPAHVLQWGYLPNWLNK